MSLKDSMIRGLALSGMQSIPNSGNAHTNKIDDNLK